MQSDVLLEEQKRVNTKQLKYNALLKAEGEQKFIVKFWMIPYFDP